MASALRRTDELQRLKTRNLVLQNPNATYPTAGAIVYIDSSAGHVGTTTGVTISAAGDITTTGNITCDNIIASGNITTPEDIICRNISALDSTGNDNEFTTFSVKRTVAGFPTVGRIATGNFNDEVFIEAARYTRFTGLLNGYGQNTVVVDVCAGVVTVNAGATGGVIVNRQAGVTAAALTVNGGSVLRTTGIDNQISTTEIWSNSGFSGGEREIGRLATDGNTGSAPSGTFYVQGERYVTLTRLNNTPGTMPVYVDVSAGQTNINGTLVLNPIGSSTPYGGATIASPLFSAGARPGEMYFTGATLYIKTTSGGANNGWRSIQLNP